MRRRLQSPGGRRAIPAKDAVHGQASPRGSSQLGTGVDRGHGKSQLVGVLRVVAVAPIKANRRGIGH